MLLWDFGDTLVDERWMLRPPASCPSWPDAWADVMHSLATDWEVGAITSRDVFSALADRTQLATSTIEAHAETCCSQLILHEAAWTIATERRSPQALVTVNPDLFAEYIVPAYRLTGTFDVIVTSFEERTADKVALCDVAIDRLGLPGSRPEALLIDNRRDLVDAWEAVGGSAYWYRSGTQFAHDAPNLFGG